MGNKRGELSPLKRAFLALTAAEDELERVKREPIAVVGVGCRFPGGADSLDLYWQMLCDGVDAVRPVPADRWNIDDYYDPDPNQPGKIVSRDGGFIDCDVSQFDAAFFGISPREAHRLDPQQRLLLEVVWEALDHAGQRRERLEGSQTGVFLGISTNDYQLMQSGDPSKFGTYDITGNAHNAAAGRIAYTLGLHGPCMAIDTACSSSLVAVHQACSSLRNEECEQALAAGVNLILQPDATIALSKAQVLSNDGRCRTFDAAADGMVRGEGCGVLVLKRLSTAERDGDQILALIRGSAVNQDGPSSGLTVPNGPAQEAVIRQALKQGGIRAADVGYIETHGTATQLGDPIEVRALAAVYGKGRTEDDPLLLGSVKTNMGHLEAAAGIAGLIKAILAVHKGEIPRHLHLENPTPLIPWGDFPVQVTTEQISWGGGEKTRMAAVSSFGFSGTNGHVVVEERREKREERREKQMGPVGAERRGNSVASLSEMIDNPPVRPQEKGDRTVELFVFSAQTEGALKVLGGWYAEALEERPELALRDVCLTAGVGRGHFEYRVGVLAESTADLAAKLRRWCEGGVVEGLVEGRAGDERKVAFLFTGQGAQYVGMGRELYGSEPIFRDVVDRGLAVLEGLESQIGTKTQILRQMFGLEEGGDEVEDLVDLAVYAQPAMFILEYGLAMLWRSWGIEPAAMMGHSLGELVAACVAGVFTFEEGVGLVAERGRLMGSLPQDGHMVTVVAKNVDELLAPYLATERVYVAAYNGPNLRVICGKKEEVAEVTAELKGEGARCRGLNLWQAFHSPHMEPILAAFGGAARRVKHDRPEIALVSNVTGDVKNEMTPDYWVGHLRRPVQFLSGMRTLEARGYNWFIEIGPKATLLGMGRRCVDDGGAAVWVPSLQANEGNWTTLLNGLAEAYVAGMAVKWEAVMGAGARKVTLPSYPFERERYWTEPSVKSVATAGFNWEIKPVRVAGDRAHRFEIEIPAGQVGFLADHVVFGEIVLPAAGYLDVVLQAGRAFWGDETLGLSGVLFREALRIPAECGVVLQVVLRQDEAGYRFELFSLAEDGEWVLHVTGSLDGRREKRGERREESTDGNDQGVEIVDVAAHYGLCARRGIEFGERFKVLREAKRGEWDAEGIIVSSVPVTGAVVHPVVLDGCLQVLATIGAGDDEEVTYLPIAVDDLVVYESLPQMVWSEARVRPMTADDEVMWVDIAVLGDDGRLLAEMKGLQLKKTNAAAFGDEVDWSDWLIELDWVEQPLAGSERPLWASGAINGLANGVRQKGDELAGDALDRYVAGIYALEDVCLDLVGDTLQSLGWQAEAHGSLSLEMVADELGVVAAQRRMLGRMVEIRQEKREERQEGWREQAERVREMYPEVGDEVTMLVRCGERLGHVLRGLVDPLPLLFPEGESGEVTAANLYGETAGAQYLNKLMGEMVQAFVAQVPAHRRLRVLEIGAGTGGTTQAILPYLPESCVYVYSDVSPLFVAQGEEKFAAFPFVEFGTLDIERPIGEQGFEAGSFDLVIGANVVHATRNLSESLGHVHELLADGGRLLLLEGLRPLRFIDLIFGLTEGWWRFEDMDVRPSHPLLTGEGWTRVLQGVGFEDVARVDGDDGVLARNGLLVAEKGTTDKNDHKRWLVLGDAGGIGEMIAAGVRGVGDVCEVVLREEWDTDYFVGVLERVRPDGVVYLWGLDEQALDGACEPVLGLVQALVERPVPLWLVTRKAQVSFEGLAQAPLWGMGRIVAQEHAEIGCVRLDLDEVGDLSCVVDELLGRGDEDQVRWREGRRLVARLGRKELADSVLNTAIELDTDGGYLVTGGLSGLGLLTAEWLVEQGAKSVVLLGRSGASDEAQGVIDRLVGQGVAVEVALGDVSDREWLAQVIAGLERPLRGVFHAAGVLRDGLLVNQTWDRFREVFAAKIWGSWYLHELTADLDLDYFVLYSSVAALLGSPAQSNHGAANAFMDGLAQARRGAGLPALSVNWGAWSDVGTVTRYEMERRLQATGIGMIDPGSGMAVMGHLMGSETVQAGVIPLDWPVYLGQFDETPAQLRDLMAIYGRDGNEGVTAGGIDSAEGWQAVEGEARLDWLREFVTLEVGRVMGSSRVSMTRPLTNLGMDSLMAIEIRNRINVGVGLDLPVVTFLDGISGEGIVKLLQERLGGETETETEVVGDVEGLGTGELLANLDDLSEEEIELLLAELDE